MKRCLIVCCWLLAAACATTKQAAEGTGEATLKPTDVPAAIAEINTQLPKMIDETTEWYAATAEDTTLVYYYRLINVQAAEINAEAVRANVKQMIRDNACTNADTRHNILDQGYTLRFAYHDKDKNPILSIDLRQADCTTP
jgi:hypothetical protein